MDKVVHFEIPFNDKNICKEFYEKVFGWKFQDLPKMNYTIARTVEVDEKQMPNESGAINGGMFKRVDDLKGVLVTIKVASIDEAIKKIKENGGEIVRKKTNVGKMGHIAYLKDTEGNVVGLWEDMKKD